VPPSPLSPMTMEAPSSASNAVTSTERADAGMSCHLTFPLRAGHAPRMALNRRLARRNLEPQSCWTEKPGAWTISPAALAGPLRESSRTGRCKSNAHENQEQPGTERCNECVALAHDRRSQALVGDRFRSRSNALEQPQIVRHRLWCLEEACKCFEHSLLTTATAAETPNLWLQRAFGAVGALSESYLQTVAAACNLRTFRLSATYLKPKHLMNRLWSIPVYIIHGEWFYTTHGGNATMDGQRESLGRHYDAET
jgi:hypothetical protein